MYERPYPRRLARSLLISNRRAARAGQMEDFEAFEADRTAPFAEVRAAEVEGFAEFDEHVQRHEQAENVFAPRVVNDVLNRHECATGRERVVSGTDEVQLFLKIPVVENHAHRDEVRRGQGVFEEIAGRGAHAFAQTGAGDTLARDGFDDGQIPRDALEMRLFLGHFYAEQTCGTTDVAEGFEF